MQGDFVMMRRFTVAVIPSILAFSILSVASALASCGSECSCPLEQPNTQMGSRFLFDINELHIDQNQPRVGTEDATVGAIPGDHDEIQTINWVTNFRALYRLEQGWAFAANLPYVDRMHEHIHHDNGEDELEHWDDRGIGDLELTASRSFASTSGPRFRFGLGLKTPTGKQTPSYTVDGEPLEASARIGTGSWDTFANVGSEWRFHAPGKSSEASMPLMLSLAGRYNGTGVENYQHGAEVQVHLSTEYPVVKHVAALFQTNYRVRAKDDVGDSNEENAGNTGGVAVYVTPGLRFDAVPGFSLYGMAQFPVYERVNGIQVVAETNIVAGISRSIF
jgi:hypothetical protein